MPPLARCSAPAVAQGSSAVVAEIGAGLQARRPHISPKYLYDTLGSRLFEAICELDEYYPTRTEAAIFARHGEDIAACIGQDISLIDLGAGNCAKAASLFPLLRPRQYVPLDISAEFLGEAVAGLQQRFPAIAMTPLGVDFSAGFQLPEHISQARRVFFYPGSSIGNFSPPQAVGLLRNLRDNLGGDGGLLIGIDLVKQSSVLDAAYNDALGVPAAFNLNLLRHVNRLAGANFDLRQWQHCAYFDEAASRIEMHLQAQCDITVRWQGGARQFARGDRIHTEDSYKYTRSGFRQLLESAGFEAVQYWTDPANWFAVLYARAVTR
ncbi:L-histidine N(alpha)-methyltransferase [Pseudoduganella danionis]|uniref:L-histidine N(Alpha)-methyltransferase n=1 Tax=Pseudoduganella danionis TaxID=1890295 RepID=A0ABW9SM92_9BURK|nr:L-histidine N(alpha)-methyltransferase [Pseudoduganella danionis]MTW32338.1 L-histidine N(alpha)-methyltransferase [Pseudoduganella danionis]